MGQCSHKGATQNIESLQQCVAQSEELKMKDMADQICAMGPLKKHHILQAEFKPAGLSPPPSPKDYGECTLKEWRKRLTTPHALHPDTTYDFVVMKSTGQIRYLDVGEHAKYKMKTWCGYGHGSLLHGSERVMGMKVKIPVVFAGEIITDSTGKIKEWNDRSGHFRPRATDAEFVRKAFGIHEKIPYKECNYDNESDESSVYSAAHQLQLDDAMQQSILSGNYDHERLWFDVHHHRAHDRMLAGPNEFQSGSAPEHYFGVAVVLMVLMLCCALCVCIGGFLCGCGVGFVWPWRLSKKLKKANAPRIYNENIDVNDSDV